VLSLAKGSIRAVVTKEDDQGVVSHFEFVELVEEISEGFVHAFDEGGVSLSVFVLSRFCVVPGKAWIGLKGGVQGIVRHVEEERLLLFNTSFDVSICFERQGFGQEGVRAVVFLQMRDRGLTILSVSLLSVITAGLACGEAADVDIETEVEWL
jgi:hypothetical protein